MRKKNSITTRGCSGKIFFWTMMALPFLQFLIFYIGVNFNSLRLAFVEYTYQGSSLITKFPSVSAFTQIFSEMNVLLPMVKNSLVFFGANLLIVTPLSLLFGYYIFRKFRGADFFKIVLFLPSVICCMVLLIFYRSFLNSTFVDVANNLFDANWEAILIAQVIPDGYTRMYIALLIFSIVVGYSGSILLYLNAMSQISSSVLEAAKIDGASELRTFFSVIIPGMWGTLVSLLCVSMANIGSNQAYLFNLFAVDAPAYIHTIGYHLYKAIMDGGVIKYTLYPYASALGILLTLVIAPATIITRKLLLKYGPTEDEAGR
jgi:ABC-type sugar transport system permease subunit